MESIKDKYCNKILNEIIIYFMKTILHLQNSGIEQLPLKNCFAEPIKSYLELAIDLMIDGQPPETADLILTSEYDVILSHDDTPLETAMCLRIIKNLSCHIHYDEDCYGYLLSTVNLWGNEVSEYASRTFYPNLPEDIKDKYGISDLIKYSPQEFFLPEDY